MSLINLHIYPRIKQSFPKNLFVHLGTPDLREILSGLEETFDIRFSDDELAYMIAMVKKL